MKACVQLEPQWLTALAQRPQTGARTSIVKLWYGRLRAFLSPGHQKEGSSFTVETPNARAGVKFSQPVIEASYDPAAKTSVFKAYTVALSVTNLITKEAKQVPQGSQVIIQEDSTLISPISTEVVPTPEEKFQEEPEEIPEEIPEEAPIAPQESLSPPQEEQQAALPATSQAPTRGSIMQQARGVVRGATSTSAPISVGVVGTGETDTTTGTGGTTTTETSTNPSPGTRPESRRRPRPVTLIIHEEEE